MEEHYKNSEANSEVMYSARDLADMHLPGFPDTERAWLDRAKNGAWKFKEVPGRGRGGIKRIYIPPAEIQALIEARQRGELPSEHAVREPVAAYSVQLTAGDKRADTLNGLKNQEPSNLRGEVDESILLVCLQACGAVYRDEFVKQEIAVQLGYAVDLYNLLVRMCHGQGKTFETVKRLEVKELAEQLGAFIKLGWAKKFPPLQPNLFF